MFCGKVGFFFVNNLLKMMLLIFWGAILMVIQPLPG